MVDDLHLRLSAVDRVFQNALLMAPEHAPEITPPLDTHKVKKLSAVPAGEAAGPGADEVPVLEAESHDLAISLATLHETNDVPGMLAQIRRALRPDGLFLACLPGGDTLHELRDSLLAAEAELTGAAHARVLPFLDVRDAGALLQRAGFALPVADRETLTVRYDTMFDLMRDLRAMGATNSLVTRKKTFTPRQIFLRAARHYQENHADADGRIRATFTLIWLSGWVPHDSQQKPLTPGTATVRLTDVLKDRSGGT